MSGSEGREFSADDMMLDYAFEFVNQYESTSRWIIDIMGDGRIKKFDAHIQTLSARKQEGLDTTHEIMIPEECDRYLNIVELACP